MRFCNSLLNKAPTSLEYFAGVVFLVSIQQLSAVSDRVAPSKASGDTAFEAMIKHPKVLISTPEIAQRKKLISIN